MEAYINGMGCISPQLTFDNRFLNGEYAMFTDEYLHCVEPDYKHFLNPTIARRASRIIKMGLVAAKLCLEESKIPLPGAIITGTGMGCIEDTEKFLTEIINNDEKMLAPSAFIQSTHNTVGAQIAIMLNCNNYNFTYVNRGFSFESAIIDALMQIGDNDADNILVGGLDEITPKMYSILKRLRFVKNENQISENIFNTQSEGTIAGEGASFFMLSKDRSEQSYSLLKGVEMLYCPTNEEEIINTAILLLKKNNLSINDVDLVLSGMNGDSRYDGIYENFHKNFSSDTAIASFKNLCGDYHTSTAFALWIASNVAKSQIIPRIIEFRKVNTKQIKNILIYNHYLNRNHTFILLSAC